MNTPTEEPLVDVVMPTYGDAPYLAASIESVLAQRFGGWRLTISENGPGGGELEARVQPYLADPRVHYVATGSNIGAAPNAAGLVTRATAEHVGLLHDDDLWYPEFLERRIEFLATHPTCGLVFSGCRVIDGAGEEVFRTRRAFPDGLQPRRSFLRTLYRSNVIYIPTVLVPRRVYDELGTFSTNILFYDYEMWLRIAAHYDVGYITGWDAAYRAHAQQTTRAETHHLGELRLRVLEEMDASLPADFPRVERRRARAAAYLHVAIDALADGEYRRAARELLHALGVYPLAWADPHVLATAAHALWRRMRIRQAWRRGTRAPG